jgi:hypothetical protein
VPRGRARVGTIGGKRVAGAPAAVAYEGGTPLTHEPHEPRERETVVVRDSGDSGLGLILGVIAILVLVAAVWFFVLGPGAGTGEQGGQDAPQVPVPTIEVPT